MSYSNTALPVLFLLGYTLLYLDVTTAYVRTRCLCIKKLDFVCWKNIDSFTVIESGPHCTQTEIVLTVKKKHEVCLNASKKQGRSLLKCWKRMLTDSDGIQKCIKKFQRRIAKKKKNRRSRKCR
ncbi:C-X-C motif chemokine 3-like [Protopterus annectens]|uniref:C-X-C motif chemokine 3-like n=1 Tax=Protopterus annectens TaxID=7888 RepID=UPI001CFC03B4|nr:C-X-C motif chemokine 3-like [Protopterus annectens]